MGARLGTPGYFGKLKATDPEKLKQISTDAAHKSADARRARKAQDEVRNGTTEDIRETD
jgi:hypothetical protein